MALITTKQPVEDLEKKRAIDFKDGDVLVDQAGRVSIRTESHVVRVGVKGSENSLFVLSLENSHDTFQLAPKGTSFTVSSK